MGTWRKALELSLERIEGRPKWPGSRPGPSVAQGLQGGTAMPAEYRVRRRGKDASLVGAKSTGRVGKEGKEEEEERGEGREGWSGKE